MARSKLAGHRWNALEDEIVNDAVRAVNMLIEDLVAGGYPYGAEPLTGRALYERLVALRMANSPLYWDDPRAQETLERLSARYGPPPAPASPPIQFMPGNQAPGPFG